MRCLLPLFLLLVATGCTKTWSDKDLVFLNVNEARSAMASSDATWLRAEKPNVWVDARSPEKFAIGHIPGAISIPLRSVDVQYGRVADHGVVIVYASTWNDPVADAQSKALMEKGIPTVRTLAGGWHAWVEAGGKVETGKDSDTIEGSDIRVRRSRDRKKETKGFK
jgi:rhodanese-related sulfurtransferase